MRKSREYNKYNIEHSIKVQGADIFNAMQFSITSPLKTAPFM